MTSPLDSSIAPLKEEMQIPNSSHLAAPGGQQVQEDAPDNRARPLTDQSQSWTPEHCKTYPRRASEEIEYLRGRLNALGDKYDDVLVPFVSLMRRELHANCGKGDRPGWLSMTKDEALLEVYYHLAKLQKAVKHDDAQEIQEFSADVANMTMMVLDICGGIADPVKEGCTRSHPHENMSADCERLTVIAREQNASAQRPILAKETGTATGRPHGCEAAKPVVSNEPDEKRTASVGGASAQVQGDGKENKHG